jgi:cytochrome c oxidase cbb3-type subunit 3
MKCATLLVVAGTAFVAAACEREDRDYRPNPVATETTERVALSPLSPGVGGPSTYTSNKGKDIQINAFHLSQGKKLFYWFNCSGCHANGGGGSGPALMDDVWIYGGDAGSVYQTIAYGRPNGMPAFASRIPKDQLWQLAAYVRSMAGLASADAAPNRDDAFLTRTPESFMDPQKPETVKPSSGSGRPQ